MNRFLPDGTRFRWHRLLFRAGCLALALASIAGAGYRLTAGRDDPVLIHFSNLGNAFAAEGNTEAALTSYRELLAIRPVSPEIEYNLANTLQVEGKLNEAVEHYRKAVELNPRFTDAHYNLANTLAGLQRFEEADGHYREAIALRPDFADAYHNRGVLLARRGKIDDAINALEHSVRLQPRQAPPYLTLGLLLSARARFAEAVSILRRGLDVAPEQPDLAGALAWIYATTRDEARRDTAEAVRLGELAVRATQYRHPQHLDALGAAFARAGRFQEAVQMAILAKNLAERQGDATLVRGLEARIALYRDKRAYVEGGESGR